MSPRPLPALSLLVLSVLVLAATPAAADDEALRHSLAIDVSSRFIPPASLRQSEPYYRPELKAFGVEGTVVLRAVIDPSGRIRRDVTVESGHPLLARAAAEALRKWRYTPGTLKGQPVDVDLQVTVSFELAPAGREAAKPAERVAARTLVLGPAKRAA